MIKKIWNHFCQFTPIGALFPILCAMGGAIFVGISPILVKLTTTGPFATGFYRILFALPLIWIWLKLSNSPASENKELPTRWDYYLMVISGIFFAIELSLWYAALTMTSVVNSTLFNNFGAFFVPLIVWVVFAHRPSMMLLYSALLGLFGASLLAWEKLSFSSLSFWGDVCALCSAVCLAAYFIIMQHLRKKFTTPQILWGTSVSSCIVLGIFTLCLEDQLIPCTLYDCLGLLTLAIFVHIAGQGFITQAMGHMSASFLSLAMLMSPVISAALAWALFGEALSLLSMFGCAIVLMSIFLAQQQKDPPDYSDPIAITIDDN